MPRSESSLGELTPRSEPVDEEMIEVQETVSSTSDSSKKLRAISTVACR